MKENAVLFYFRAGGDAFSQNIERSLSIFFLIAVSYMYIPVAAMCFLPNFAPRRIWQAFMCSHLCTYSHSYIRYFLNFLSVIGSFTTEQLSFTACFGGLLPYTYATAGICFLLNNFCTGLFELLQFSRQRPSFSAHRAALMTKSDLIFPAFFFKICKFRSLVLLSL